MYCFVEKSLIWNNVLDIKKFSLIMTVIKQKPYVLLIKYPTIPVHIISSFIGLCKSGSVVFQTLPVKPKNMDSSAKKMKVGDADSTKVSMLMAYNIDSGETGQSKVLIYQGETMQDKAQVIGVVLVIGESY